MKKLLVVWLLLSAFAVSGQVPPDTTTTYYSFHIHQALLQDSLRQEQRAGSLLRGEIQVVRRQKEASESRRGLVVLTAIGVVMATLLGGL